MMNTKKRIWITVLIMIVAIASFSLGRLLSLNNDSNGTDASDSVMISYGDTISSLELTDLNGKFVENPFYKNPRTYGVIFYLSSKCSSCERELVAANNLKAILEPDRYSVYIVYEDTIPASADDNTIDGVYCASRTKIALTTPSVIMTDSDGKVVFVSDDTSTLMEKIVQQEDDAEVLKMRDRANESFLKTHDDSLNEKEKNVMVYFRMDECPDCEAVTPILNDSEIEKKFTRIDVYTKDSYGEKDLVDVDDIYATLFGIDWYPSFELISNNGSKILGKMGIDEICEELKSF